MSKNSAVAGPGAMLVAYIFLIILGMLFLWLSFGEVKDILKIGLKKAGSDQPTLAVIFLSLGLGCILHGGVKIREMRLKNANKETMPLQPWYHSGYFSGFSADVSPLTGIIYAVIIGIGLTAFSIRVWGAREDYWIDSIFHIFSEDGLETAGAVLLFLSTLICIIYAISSIYSFVRFGQARIELSQMPLTPGCEFTVLADVSAKIPRNSKAVFQLLCHHRKNYKAGNKSESDFETEVETEIESEVSLKKARQQNDRLLIEASMKIPEDASPNDDSNPDETREWELKLTIDFGYDLSLPAPVFKPRKDTDIKFNPRLKKVSAQIADD